MTGGHGWHLSFISHPSSPSLITSTFTLPLFWDRAGKDAGTSSALHPYSEMEWCFFQHPCSIDAASLVQNSSIAKMEEGKAKKRQWPDEQAAATGGALPPVSLTKIMAVELNDITAATARVPIIIPPVPPLHQAGEIQPGQSRQQQL